MLRAVRQKVSDAMRRASDALIDRALRMDPTIEDLRIEIARPAAKPVVPAAAGDVTSEATSDLILMQLETIFAGAIPGTAASMAVGYADAYARFALRHPDAFE